MAMSYKMMLLFSKEITKQWPVGLEYLVVRGHMKKFKSIDTISKVEIRQQLNQITMKIRSYPVILCLKTHEYPIHVDSCTKHKG
jgi:hypothetical protein